jgi:hypothetical protein
MNAQRLISFALAALLLAGTLGSFGAVPVSAATTNQAQWADQWEVAPPAWGPFLPFFTSFHSFRPFFSPIAFRSFRPFFYRITVKAGQTLNQIAARFDISAARLARINGLANPNLIVTGMPLFIPSFRSFRFRPFSVRY